MPASISVEQVRPELTWRLRRDVLYPTEPWYKMGMDEDEAGYHFGAFDDNQLVGVISLFQRGEAGQFRKFAVAATHQRRGIGTDLLCYLTDFAKIGGGNRLWCNARIPAVGFYQKQGYAIEGEEFTKNGIGYVVMGKTI